tara:strand:+ start:1280 stop:1618 length:339 start_codon:yes stop_codon:yes gene_type:complete
MNDINPVTSTLDLLEAYHNDKDFDEMISRNKFLRECKAKGFERMKRLGLISNDKTTRRGIRFTDEQKREFASRAYELRQKGLTYKLIQAELGGVAEKSIREWMKKYDVSSSK